MIDKIEFTCYNDNQKGGASRYVKKNRETAGKATRLD